MYGLFTFEALHNLHLGILKMLNEFEVLYFSSETVVTSDGGQGSMGRPLPQMRKAGLSDCNSNLSAMVTNIGRAGLRFDFPKGDTSND